MAAAVMVVAGKTSTGTNASVKPYRSRGHEPMTKSEVKNPTVCGGASGAFFGNDDCNEIIGINSYD